MVDFAGNHDISISFEYVHFCGGCEHHFDGSVGQRVRHFFKHQNWDPPFPATKTLSPSEVKVT